MFGLTNVVRAPDGRSLGRWAQPANKDTMHRADAALYSAKDAGRNRVMLGSMLP